MGSQIYSIVNQKGGVGKSTTAVNAAVYIAAAGYKTLLIDCDSQANASRYLGFKNAKEKNIYRVLMGKMPAGEAVLATSNSNLEIIPAVEDLVGAEVELVPIIHREARLKTAIEPLKKKYDYIIMDSPPSLGLLTVNTLVAAQKLIVTIQPEFFALDGASRLLDTINLVKKGLNPKLEISGVLITLYDKRLKSAKEIVGTIKKYFGEKVYKTAIPRCVALSESSAYGKSIAEYAPTSVAATAYKTLVKEVLEDGR